MECNTIHFMHSFGLIFHSIRPVEVFIEWNSLLMFGLPFKYERESFQDHFFRGLLEDNKVLQKSFRGLLEDDSLEDF